MGRVPKSYIQGTTIELSSRTEEDLPLIATVYMRLILKSYLARAQELYPVALCAVMIMANHFHFIIVVDDPEMVSEFVGYFKRETAHAVNSLLGREKHTVWAEGFDSPIVLDAAKVVDRLVYFYTNPQRDRIVDTIDEYSQVNSWSACLSGGTVLWEVPTFPRPAVPALDFSKKIDAEKVYNTILEGQHGTARLVIDPFAWMKCFLETADHSPDAFIREVSKRVRSSEMLFRLEKGTEVLGADALERQDIRKRHTPKKWGRRSLCLATLREHRRDYMVWAKGEAEKARSAIRDWRKKGTRLILPPGFYAPGGKLSANIWPTPLFV